jgi:ATP-dependent RNA helicase DeaD
MPATGPHGDPEVLRALEAAVRRGRNVAMLAAAGSGHERVFGTAIESACEAGAGLQALVLVPTRDAALRVGAGAAAVLSDSDLAVLVWPPVAGGADGGQAEVLIGRPIALLKEIRGGRMQTAGVKLICIDGADHALRLGEWPAAEALLDVLGGEAQKVVASGSFENDLADLVERHVARPKRWPEELFVDHGSAGGTAGDLWCGAAAREEERIDLLAAALGDASGVDGAASLVLCTTQSEAERIRAGLHARGVSVVEGSAEEGAPSAGVVVTTEPAHMEGELAIVARWGPPDDIEAYQALPAAGRRIAIVDSLHLQQLRLLARRARWRVRLLGGGPPAEQDAVQRFRETVQSRLQAGDLSAELLLLRPLLEENSTTDVATALAALLRERGAIEARAETGPGKPAARGPATPGEVQAVLPAWTKIFVNVGKRDGAGPGDIVGAITGETGAAGGQIGLIELRASFTLVDVDAEIADRVIQGLSGTQIKGRTVSARRAKEGI